MAKCTRSQKGITLIALIVTIIVILILSGVSLNIVLGDKGIIKQAQTSKNEYEDKVKDTQEDIDGLYNELIGDKEDDGGIKVTTIKLEPTTANLEVGDILNLTDGLTIEPENATNNRVIWTSSNPEIAKVNSGIVTTLAEGTARITVTSTDGSNVSATCNIRVIKLPSTNVTKPYLPGNNFDKVPGTDLDNGLIIEDNIGNQYVWVEVPKTSTVYPTAGLKVTEFTTDEYKKIENDLHTYTNYYRKGTTFTDTYHVDSTTGWFKNSQEYDELKQKMLKSVYKNGGFWIGRYEAGIETNRTSSGTATKIPLSQPNKYPYTYVTRTQAHVLAQKVNSGNYNSSLMFGVQWDLVIKFLETKGVTKNELSSDCKSWGNYRNSTFKLNRGKYAKSDAENKWYNYTQNLTNCVVGGVKQSSTNTSNSVLLTTGASDATKKINIYDLAGNIYEWTLEKSTVTSYPCTARGGYYEGLGSSGPSNYRSHSFATNSSQYFGFRVVIY